MSNPIDGRRQPIRRLQLLKLPAALITVVAVFMVCRVPASQARRSFSRQSAAVSGGADQMVATSDEVLENHRRLADESTQRTESEVVESPNPFASAGALPIVELGASVPPESETTSITPPMKIDFEIPRIRRLATDALRFHWAYRWDEAGDDAFWQRRRDTSRERSLLFTRSVQSTEFASIYVDADTTDHTSLSIENLANNAVSVYFLVDQRLHELAPGKTLRLQGEDERRIQFDRGGDFGRSSMGLVSGRYFFKATPDGWVLHARTNGAD